MSTLKWLIAATGTRSVWIANSTRSSTRTPPTASRPVCGSNANGSQFPYEPAVPPMVPSERGLSHAPNLHRDKLIKRDHLGVGGRRRRGSAGHCRKRLGRASVRASGCEIALHRLPLQRRSRIQFNNGFCGEIHVDEIYPLLRITYPMAEWSSFRIDSSAASQSC